MKIKLTLSILVLLLSVNLSHASFPVNRQVQTTNVTEVNSNENVTSFVPAAAASGKSQITAAILCWLVGIIGIHRFYLGYTWQGIVQILTLGGLGIWTLIDLIRIIIGSLEPKNGSYAKTF